MRVADLNQQKDKLTIINSKLAMEVEDAKKKELTLV